MFDFLRNLTKSAEDKRHETVAAYVDGTLDGRLRQQFEQEMAQDATLQAEVEQLRVVRQSLRQLPMRDVPRNFVLNPADYKKPAPQPWVQAYPVLRTATAMAAFFFIFALAAGTFTGLGGGEPAISAPAADIAQVEAVEELGPAESFATAADAAADEEMAGEPAADAMMADEEMAEEEMAEEEQIEEETVEEIEETMAEDSAAAPPVLAATAPALATASPQATETAQGHSGTADDSSADEVPAPESTTLPTPTVSTLPRVTPPTPLPERDLELTEADEAASSEIADAPEAEIDSLANEVGEDDAAVGETAVSNEPIPVSSRPLPWLQIGLGLLLLLLVGLTFYARKQR